jgi:acetolactate synthase regulatory subunit
VSGFSIAKSPNRALAKFKEGTTMQVFHIRYRNAQGVLMRILNAVSRRGLDLTSVHAEYAGQDHAVTLLLEVSHKQIGQLYREWYAIVDVVDVRSGAALREHEEAVWAPHPPASVAEQSARAARA